MNLSEVNSLTREDFINIFSNVVENYQGCAERLSKERPFHSRNSLLRLVVEYLHSLSANEKERILRLHPDLAGRIADETHLTAESQVEQRCAGLRNISLEDTLELSRLNEEYKSKFKFPFVICARENKFESILKGLKERICHTMEEELKVAIEEVKKITSYRIIEK